LYCRIPATADLQLYNRRVQGVQAMWRFKSLLIAAPVAAGLLFAPAAHAGGWHGGGGGWHGGGGGGWHGGGGGWHGGGWNGGWRGPGWGLPLLGLGAAAVIGGVIASQAYVAPPVVYAPPPVYYAPPPVYYAQPPGYGPPPGYYAQPPG
jgi:hypothetical protein